LSVVALWYGVHVQVKDCFLYLLKNEKMANFIFIAVMRVVVLQPLLVEVESSAAFEAVNNVGVFLKTSMKTF
jgi:hypothetical protein